MKTNTAGIIAAAISHPAMNLLMPKGLMNQLRLLGAVGVKPSGMSSFCGEESTWPWRSSVCNMPLENGRKNKIGRDATRKIFVEGFSLKKGFRWKGFVEKGFVEKGFRWRVFVEKGFSLKRVSLKRVFVEGFSLKWVFVEGFSLKRVFVWHHEDFLKGRHHWRFRQFHERFCGKWMSTLHMSSYKRNLAPCHQRGEWEARFIWGPFWEWIRGKKLGNELKNRKMTFHPSQVLDLPLFKPVTRFFPFCSRVGPIGQEDFVGSMLTVFADTWCPSPKRLPENGRNLAWFLALTWFILHWLMSKYRVAPRCSVTFWTHPEIMPVGQFFRQWILRRRSFRLIDWLTISSLWLDWFIGFVPHDLFLRGRG